YGYPDLNIAFGLCAGLLKSKKKLLNQNKLTLIYIHVCLILIMLAFDTETNPGPVRPDLCGICDNVAGWHPERGIFCEECCTWYHAQCQGMNTLTYDLHCEHPDDLSKKKNLGFLTMRSTVKPDIVLGTESWLKPHIKSPEVFPSDYKIYRKDRKRRTGRGWGVFILVLNKFVSTSPAELKTDSETMWVQVKQKCKHDLYCLQAKPRLYSCIEDISRTVYTINNSNNTIVVGGDFNLGDMDWKSLRVNSGATHSKERYKLLELAENLGFKHLVDNTKIIPGFSDHCIPFLDITSGPRINFKERRSIVLLNKADWNRIIIGVQELWDSFTSILEKLIKPHIPTITVNGKQHLPWIDTDIKNLLKKRVKLYCTKKSQSHYQKKTRVAYWDYINNIVCDPSEHKEGTTKKCWPEKDSSGVAPLRDEWLVRTNSIDKANILNRQFSSISPNQTNPYSQTWEDLNSLATWEKRWKMSFYVFNVDKCHFMHVSKSRKIVVTDNTLHNEPLTRVQQATYLGLELLANISWTPHINKITGKASQSLGFLRRNFHSVKPETKATAYKSIVRPSLEYCSSVWDPFQMTDIQKLEQVQRRAARFVTNNYAKAPGTVTNIMNQLNWESLERRRQTSRLSLFYKSHYGLVDITASQYMTPYQRNSGHFHHLAYQIPHSNTHSFLALLSGGTHYRYM
ncbi:LOW QUALITY PROTEIN: hypothetical protein MAR_015520, partial [Mya arenaria]